MIRRLIILLLIVGCAPKSYIGMTEEEFINKKPELKKYAVKDSYLSGAIMNIEDPNENEDLTYFYTERNPKLGVIEWLTFGRVNGYFYYFDPETDTLSYIHYGNAKTFENKDFY